MTSRPSSPTRLASRSVVRLLGTLALLLASLGQASIATAADGTAARTARKAAATATPAKAGNDFPTLDRVVYVHDCMRDNAGAPYEMMSKCSCAIDHIASQINYEDFTHAATAAQALTIGGERGSYIRDAEGLKPEIRKYRELQASARKACMFEIHSPQ